MTDNKTSGDKTLTVSKTLSLKRPVEQGVVKQSFSHGRTKSVVVETVKRRPGGMDAQPKPPVVETKAAPPPPPRPATSEARPATPGRLGLGGGSAGRTLTSDERDARAQVLQEAMRRQQEEDNRRRESEQRAHQERERLEREARERAAAAKAEAPAQPVADTPAAPAVGASAPISAPMPEPRAESRPEARPATMAAPVSTPVSTSGPTAAASSHPPASPRPAPPMAPRGAAPQGAPSQPRSSAPLRDFGERPPRLDGPSFRRSGEGGGPRPGGEPQRDGPRRDGSRFDGARSASPGPRPGGAERPAGTIRLGFAPRPGQAPAPGSRPPGSRPPGGARPPIGGAALGEDLEALRPKRDISAVPARPAARDLDDDDARTARRGGVKAPAPAKPERTKGPEKSRGRLTVTSVLSDEDERQRSIAAFKRRVQRMKGMAANEPKEKIIREVIVPETITIQELANRMSERGVDVIRLLMRQGAMHKITDVIDADTAQLVAEEMGHSVRRVAEADVEEGLFDAADDETTMIGRPPVVTIMGHVDHGKTSLLDSIRQTNVVSGEAGGITQHIGAYQVTTPLGGKVTFIDTPGHAAFTAMRARGAKVTDIVVLVVAADDGVMPQTIEAINHAKAAKVPLIVAINKIDKPEAKPERVRTELLQHDVQVESMGGDTLEIEVSAKQKLNLDKLLEAIQLQAEVLELKANPERAAEGSVVEAKLDRGRGPVATVLVQRGTLHTGDIVVAGAQWGRVRALVDDRGENVTEAGPSLPVEILGFQGAPEAGDRVAVVESEARAREITAYRERQKRDKAAARGGGQARSLVDMMKLAKDAAGKKEFPLLIKGDVQGSVEAIAASVEKLGNDEVAARVLHTAVGGITESDVTLANTTGAVILAFNVRAHKEAREAAERAGVEIRYYNVIYDLVDDVKAAMSGLLAPTLRETMLGNAEIRQVFNITKVGNVAGCQVTDGKVERGAKVRLIRDNVVIHEGTLKTLKRFKDEVKDVMAGQECGMAFQNYEDMRAGDVIECFRVEEIQRSL